MLVLIGSCFEGTFVEQTVPAEPRDDASTQALDDAFELILRRRTGGVKRDALLAITRENTIEEDSVKMNVQIQASAESLDEGHGSAFRSVESLALRASAVVLHDDFDEDASERTEDVCLDRGERTELERE
jgi:hypothetical protein